MKKAFIILAYKDPEQIERLVKVLHHENFHFYVHVDLKFDLEPFLYLGKLPNVFLVQKRHKMIWASYRFIEVLTLIMEELIEMNRYDFISPFSGQDYPLKSPEEINQYYCENLGKSFMTIVDKNSKWLEECKARYEKYHLTYYSFKGVNFISKIINSIMPKRIFPVYKEVYGGPRATWLTLSIDAAEYVVKKIKTEKALRKFCKYTWAPDEFLIPTLLMNSHFRDLIVFDSGRFIDWSEGGCNPKIFREQDFSILAESNKLYARKFDINVDQSILDLLDAHVYGIPEEKLGHKKNIGYEKK